MANLSGTATRSLFNRLRPKYALWSKKRDPCDAVKSTVPETGGWMSGWMEKDGVLSSFQFQHFRNNLQIRSSYAPLLKPLEIQRFFIFMGG